MKKNKLHQDTRREKKKLQYINYREYIPCISSCHVMIIFIKEYSLLFFWFMTIVGYLRNVSILSTKDYSNFCLSYRYFKKLNIYFRVIICSLHYTKRLRYLFMTIKWIYVHSNCFWFPAKTFQSYFFGQVNLPIIDHRLNKRNTSKRICDPKLVIAGWSPLRQQATIGPTDVQLFMEAQVIIYTWIAIVTTMVSYNK